MYKNEYYKNEPIYYNCMNFKPIAVKSRRRPAVAAASRSPAEEKTSPLSGRNCMPPSLGTVERPSPGRTTSKDGMNGY